MTPLQIEVTATTSKAKAELQSVQAELAKVAVSAQKTDSSLQKFAGSFDKLASTGTKSLFILGEKLKELQNVAFTEKDLTKVAKYNTQIEQTEKEIARLSNAGKTGFNELGESIGKVGSPLTKAYSGLRVLANIIPGIGIGGLVGLIAGPLVDALQKWFEGTDRVSAATKILKANQDDLNDIVKDAAKDAGKQTTDLQLLYAAATNVNLSLKDRLAAVTALQTEFPAFFANISKETILNGGAKKQYDELTKSILANATATAAKSKLDAIQSEQIENNIKRQAIEKKNEQDLLELDKRKSIVLKGAGGAADVTLTGAAVKEQNINAEVALAKKKELALKDIDLNDQILKGRRDFIIGVIGLSSLAKAVETALPVAKPAREKVVKAAQETAEVYTETLQHAINQLLKGSLVPDDLNTTGKIDPKGGIKHPTDAIIDAGKALNDSQEKLDKMAAFVQDSLTPIFGTLFTSIADGSQNAFQAFGSALKSIIVQLAATVAKAAALAAIMAFIFPGSTLGKEGFGALFHKFLGFAGGVTNFQGGVALVGEKGPELVTLPRGSNVIPNNQISGAMGGTQVFIPSIEFRGADMLIMFNRAQAQASRNG